MRLQLITCLSTAEGFGLAIELYIEQDFQAVYDLCKLVPKVASDWRGESHSPTTSTASA